MTLGGLARSAPGGLPWPGWQGLQEQLGRLPGGEGLPLQVLLGNDRPRPLLPLPARCSAHPHRWRRQSWTFSATVFRSLCVSGLFSPLRRASPVLLNE